MLVLPPVAKNIHLPCKKCGVDRFHVVTAHTSANTAKVKCEVCGASKTFKLPKAQERKKVTKKVSTSKVDHGAVWIGLKEKMSSTKSQPYSMKAKFTNNAVIDHPKFGLGLVTLVTNEKIEVIFETGPVSLVHGRT